MDRGEIEAQAQPRGGGVGFIASQPAIGAGWPRAISAATKSSRRAQVRSSAAMDSHAARTLLPGPSHAPTRALGVESRITRIGRSSPSTTLPPNEWPTAATTGGPAAASASHSAARSPTHAATVWGGAPAVERPCSRRSTSTAAQPGARATTCRAIARQLVPLP